MRLYLDACILGRLSDDRSQPRVAAEVKAIAEIFRLLYLGKTQWLASSVLRLELTRNPDEERQADALSLLSHAPDEIEPDDPAISRAKNLADEGYGVYDALHLACAEMLQADALLTVDDRFIRAAKRMAGNPKVLILNPVDWLRENTHGSV